MTNARVATTRGDSSIDDEARLALITLGFKPYEARDAVDETRTHEGTAPITLEVRIRAALQAAARARGTGS